MSSTLKMNGAPVSLRPDKAFEIRRRLMAREVGLPFKSYERHVTSPRQPLIECIIRKSGCGEEKSSRRERRISSRMYITI